MALLIPALRLPWPASQATATLGGLLLDSREGILEMWCQLPLGPSSPLVHAR